MRRINTFIILSMMIFTENCTHAQSGGHDRQGEVIVLNKADFLSKIYNYEKNTSGWVYEGVKPCIIDFYADWCGPCKMIAPIMKELAAEYKEDLLIYKINIDQEQELAAYFGIHTIPFILFVPKEGPPQAAKGALPKKMMVEQIDRLLLGKKPESAVE